MSRASRVDRLEWRVLASLATVSLCLSMWGFWRVDAAGVEGALELGWAQLANYLYSSLKLFILDGPSQVAEEHYALHTARFLAPLSVLGTAAKLLASAYDMARLAGRLVGQKRVVLVGLDGANRLLADEFERDGFAVSIVEADYSPDLESHCRAHRLRLYPGDPRDRELLADAGVADAEYVVVSCGSDVANLEVAEAASELMRRGNAGIGDLASRLHVSVRDAELAGQLRGYGRFVAYANPFSLPGLSTRRLFQLHPIHEYAELRAQDRVHVVLVGWNEISESLLTHVASSCHYRDFGRPLLSVLTPDSRAVELRLRARHPQIDGACELHFADFDIETSDLAGSDALRAVEERVGPPSRSTVTAVFLCLGSDTENVKAALRLNAYSLMTHRLLAPKFLHMASGEGLKGVLARTDSTPRFNEVIEPFGMPGAVASKAQLIDRANDWLARGIHQQYREGGGASEAAKTRWEELAETHKEANRRAADHVPVKLASLGLKVPALPPQEWRRTPDVDLPDDPASLEALARLEHRRWCAERSIEGWRYGPLRDDERRHHPLLVPFDDLTDDERRKDTDQIVKLRELVRWAPSRDSAPDPASVIRRDVWIGISGHISLSSDERAWLREVLEAEVFPALLGEEPWPHVTLASALAPGSDTIFAEVGLQLLADHPHRLIVPSPLPLDLYGADLAESVDLGPSRELARRAQWLIDLVPPGICSADLATDPALREVQYQRATAYVVERSEILVVVDRDEGKGGPGGTAQALTWRAGREPIPPELSSLPPGRGFPRSWVHINPAKRTTSL